MLDYNSYGEEDNPKFDIENVEALFKTNNYLQNDVQIIEQRGEKNFEPRSEIRVELVTPTSNKNMKNNHPLKR